MKPPDPDKTKTEGGKPGERLDPAGPAEPNQLTSEEQMDLYEKELKENDWGHQPC
ncbi:MAG: hypothetical protein WAO02_00865 [Verrucomicrobiia bacterium]